MHPNVHCSTIYNSQDMEATLMSINRGMDKEDVYTYTMEYYSANYREKEIMPFAATQTKLEHVTLSEACQTEKEKYFMTSLICGI